MIKKLFSSIYFLIISVLCFAQLPDEIELLKTDILNKYNQIMQISDDSVCINMIELAHEKYVNDSIFLPVHFELQNISSTMKEILIREYGFYNFDITKSDLIDPEIMCFEKYMIGLIELTYGDTFLDSIINVSDGLDYINLGYIKPRLKNDSVDFREYLFENINNWDTYFNTNVLRVISFSLDSDARISNVNYLEAPINPVMKFVSIKDEKIISELDEIMRNMPKWNPAMLKGIPITDQVEIILNLVPFSD